MSQAALRERIGSVLKLVESGKSAEIVRSWKVSGDFPANRDIEVIFDFAKHDDGTIAVQLSRRLGSRTSKKEWSLAAIEDRDPKGLGGFIEFAASLGLKGAQLAKLIEGFKPPG